MSGLAPVTRRATTASGRSRRNIYSGDYETESADHASGTQPVTGGIFKNAAFEILKQEERLMTSGEITKLAMERRLLRCMGKTPENTMASALYTEVRKKASTTVFIKPKEGLFGLKAWLNEPWLLNWLAQEGIDPADVHDPGGVAEPVSKKLRTSYNGAASRGGAGSSYAHRTSSNGTSLLRSSSAGLGGSGGGAPAGNSGHRASLNGGPAPGGSGAGGRVSLASLAGTAAAGGAQKVAFVGAGGRAGAANDGSAGPNSASGAVSDTLSSLHLLVDAADEIEGGPEEVPRGVQRPPPGRRRSDGVLRQTSFRRQRPPISRDTSLPSMIARVRVRDDYEDEQEDTGAAAVAAAAMDDDDDLGEGEERDDSPAYQGDDAALRRDALRMLQLRKQSSNRLYHRMAAPMPSALLQDPHAEHHLRHQESYGQRAQQQQRSGPRLRGTAEQAAGECSEGELEDEEEDGGPGTVDGGPDGQQHMEQELRREGRWGQAEEDDRGQHPGVYRGVRGGRGGGRSAGTHARGRRGRGRGRGRTASGTGRAGESEEEDEGQQDDEAEEAEDGSGDEEEVEAAGAAAQPPLPPPPPRRWALPPRPNTDRRSGGSSGGGSRQLAGAQRCSSSGRLHPDIPLPPHMQLPPHLGGRGFPVQMPIPMLHMPPGSLGHGPHAPPLQLLQRMPPPSPAMGPGLPLGHPSAAVNAMLAAGGPGPMPGGGPLGLGPLHGLGPMGLSQAQLGALLGPQALPSVLGMGLGPGLGPLEMGALLGDASGGDPRGYGLPPRLTQIASTLGRSPKLSAQLVAVQEKIAELNGVGAEQEDAAADGAGVKSEATEPMVKEAGRSVARAAPTGTADAMDADECEAEAHARDVDPQLGDGVAAAANYGAPEGCGGAALEADVGPVPGDAGLVASEHAADVLDSCPASRGPWGDGGTGGTAAPEPRPQDREPARCTLTSLTPAGVTVAAAAGGSVAVHDAMNSPDSQLAGGAERASPVVADEPGQSRSDDKVAQLGPSTAPAAVAAAAVSGPAAGPRGLGSAGHATAAQGQGQANGSGTQLTLLQQQHLKLLLPVEAARPGDVPDPDSINRILHQVLDMESRMGSLHPETGRAYVLLARVLEHKGTCWSLAMAERALLRAWTIVGVVASTSRRSSEAGGGAGGAPQQPGPPSVSVSGVAEAAAAEAPGEVLGQLPDSFHTFHYLLEQIRMKQAYLLDQQEQQLAGLLQMVAMVGANAAATLAAGPPGMGPVNVGSGAAAAALGSLIFGGTNLPPGVCGEGPFGPPAGMPL